MKTARGVIEAISLVCHGCQERLHGQDDLQHFTIHNEPPSAGERITCCCCGLTSKVPALIEKLGKDLR